MGFNAFSQSRLSRLLLLGLFSAYFAWARADLPSILVVMPDNDHFLMALEGIEQEIGSEFKIESFLISRQTQPSELLQKVQAIQPKLLVLMDNKATNLYRHYTGLLHKEPAPPALILMSVLLGQEIDGIPNATGIEYEIQGITVFTNLRALVKNPINKVGVIYRSNLKNFFRQQQVLCAKEEIELVGYEVPLVQESYKKQIKRGINKLKDQDIEALWILNDSILITSELLAESWLPSLRSAKFPVVAGLAKFVQDSVPLGEFAVVPDHTALGQQAAGMILEIQEANWSVKDFKLRPPRSVQKILNLKNLPKNIKVNHTVITELDQVIR